MKLGKFELDKIYCGDCLELMKDIPDESIDLILTDPPYPETNHFKKMDLSYIGQELWRILKDNTFLVSDFFRPNIPYYLNIYKPLQYYDMMTAFVINSMACCALGVDRFTPSLIFRKGKPKVYKKWSNVIQVVRIPNKKFSGHPTQKYFKYYRTIINMFSKKEDIILDPFMGSGTTAVACVELHRHFLGFEINSEYVKMANRRLESVQVSML